MPPGRHPVHQPALAFDYSRHIALVQVLAIDDPLIRQNGLVQLATAWGIAIPADLTGGAETAHRIARALCSK